MCIRDSSSSAKYCALCALEKESKPPANIRPSKSFLLAARKSILLVTSKIDVKWQFSFLSLIIAFTAELPTPFMAPIQKRTAPCLFTENFK